MTPSPLMSDSRVLADHDVQKLRSLLGADEDDAFRLGVTLLEACQPTPADYDAVFDDDFLRDFVKNRDVRRWNDLLDVIHDRCAVLRRFRGHANQFVQTRDVSRIRLRAYFKHLVFLAEIFACARGPLCLDSLRWVSPAVAAKLCDLEGPLSLRSVSQLSRDAAIGLAPHTGLLCLPEVHYITSDVAQALAQHDGDLELGLDSLSEETAAALAGHRYGLYLGNLEAVSDQTVAVLAGHVGPSIHLGLTSLSSFAAKALAGRDRKVSFVSLRHVSDDALTELFDGCGFFHFGFVAPHIAARIASLNAVFKTGRITWEPDDWLNDWVGGT